MRVESQVWIAVQKDMTGNARVAFSKLFHTMKQTMGSAAALVFNADSAKRMKDIECH
jgi:hypothetical protein